MGLRNRGQLKHETCFFVTTTCNNWMKLIHSDQAFRIIIDSLNFLTAKYHCHILAYVIMPNHLHLILYFPAENKLSDYMRDFKKFTSVKLRHELEQNDISLEPLRHEIREQKFKIWKDRFDDVSIRTKEMFHTKLEYIHNNPLQAHWNLTAIAEAYPYSSAAFYNDNGPSLVNITTYDEFIW